MMLLPTLLVWTACCTPAVTPVAVVDLAPDDHAACATSDDCESDQFCNKPVGECDVAGTCERRPEICTADFSPVCGCDEQTYANRCTAAAAGQSVAHDGECEDQDED